MMRFLPSCLQQECFTKMNRNSANTCLTDMTNISIESFKFITKLIIIIIIHKDALLSKGTSNEEPGVRIGNFILATRTQKALVY